MRLIKSFPILMIALLLFSGCSHYLDVRPSENLSAQEVFGDITRAQQFLYTSYRDLPVTPRVSMDYYTDNAVAYNEKQRAATGGWTSEDTPTGSLWDRDISNIIRINEFLEKGFNIPYDAYDTTYSNTLKKRIKGEAFGLKAFFEWDMLKNFAGPSAKNPAQMLGFPIMDHVITIEDANDIARGTYEECFNKINQDLDSAYLYINILRYDGSSALDNRNNIGRISGEMILALKARMYLFVASPVYKMVSWDSAARVAYNAINMIDGGALKDLRPFGDFDDPDNPDILWRSPYSSSSTMESNYYPPSMFGKGACNPSQNLVDAFPASNGYPISDSKSLYDPTQPYSDRDPRLRKFIFVNGHNDFRDSYIETYTGGHDAPGGIRLMATRTGYYMKKFLSSKVNLDPEVSSGKSDYSFNVFYSRSALYLDFAEAAVEAYGLSGKAGDMAFSAIDALQKIRERAGIVNDEYLTVAATDLDKLKALIHNERRLELCFTGARFYDLRRWKIPLEEMNKPVEGMLISKSADSSFTYKVDTVEQRRFEDYMYYAPIPRSEIIRSHALIQNNGW